MNWTETAEIADEINAVIKENYGWGAIKLAKALLKLDMDEVKAKWFECVKIVEERLDKGRFNKRISVKYAIFYITAIYEKELLGIDVNADELLDFLCENDKLNEVSNLNISETAYDILLQEIAKNSDRFNLESKGEHWGDSFENGSKLLILTNVFDKIMTSNGFENPKLILNEWRSKGLLIAESDRLVSRRTFDKGKAYEIIVSKEDSTIFKKGVPDRERNENRTDYNT